MTKIGYFRNPELTLGELGIEAMFMKLHEDEPKMFLMFFLRFGVDKNVIEIDHHELVEVFVKTEFMSREKVAGAFVRPKDMTVYS